MPQGNDFPFDFQAPDLTDDDLRIYPSLATREDHELISLEQIARECYENGIPKKRWLVQIRKWFPCPDCGEAVANVVFGAANRFVADVEWRKNDLGLPRPFADLQSKHHCGARR